jgi:hypothetical protein
MPHVFLLSPASLAGKRARVLLRDEASFPLARRVKSAEGAPIGEVFAFLSGLYFRGKLAYATAFGVPLVITSNRGLLPADVRVTRDELLAFGEIDIDGRDPRYLRPLLRDARRVEGDSVVLLGSVASSKYVEALLDVFGERLLFPAEFLGRGDMSRGGLLLRAVRAGEELAYARVVGSARRGTRPPRLAPCAPAWAARRGR